MKTMLLAAIGALMATGAAAVEPQPAEKSVCAGTLETFTLHSPQLGRDMTVEVLLPSDYEAATPRPVVYMHDGQNLFDAERGWNKQAWEMDEAVERIVAEGRGLAPIIVGVYSVNELRVAELMPTEAIASIPPAVVEKYQKGRLDIQGARGDRYVDFLVETLKPVVDSLYATLPDMANTSVMGSSMGGLASFYALCRHPEVFGSAACLSTHFIGTFEPNEVFPTAFAAYLLANFPVDGQHRIYFDTGDQELDGYYIPYFDRTMEMLREMGCTDETLKYAKWPGHVHNENCWASRVDVPLRFLLR